MKEWDDNTNSSMGLFPEVLSPYSHKKASWKCYSCGNVWIAAINSRSRGRGCPNCKVKKISQALRKVKPKNSLFERFPHIAEEWHPTKNETITPKDVNSGSSDKYWWKCKYGHEWEATVNNRTSSHTNCPKCSDEMHTSFPEQAVFYYLSHHFACQNRALIENREVDIYIPDKSIGIEYDGRYYHKKADRIREEEKDAFLHDIGVRIIRIKEDTFNQVEPNCIHYIYSSSNYRQLDWAISELLKMFNIEEVVDVDANQVDILGQYVQSIKDSSLQAKYPELAEEWDVDSNNGIAPDMISAGSHKKVFWRCNENHTYCASINARVRYYKQGKSFGCPYCSGHKVLRGYNDLQTKNPELAKEWDQSKNGDITPSDITAGSSRKKYWWKCQMCGNTWEATVSNRTNGRGCPNCKPLTISKALTERAAKEKSFADIFPELICEWDSSNTIKPTEVAPRSNKKVVWVCSKCGHKWTTSVNNRATGYGCRECYLKNRKIQNKRAIICVETNEIFESIADASQKMNISRSGIINCLSGRSRSSGGFHWQYKEQ